MPHRPLASIATITMLAASAACATTNSATLATNQIKPVFAVEVSATGPRTYVSAILGQPGSMSNVLLAPGDTLTARTDKDAQLALEYNPSLQIYSATLANVGDRTTVTFSLARATGAAAPTSTVQIPAAIALTSPTPNQQVSYAGGTGTLKVAWSNAIAGATAHFFGYPCGAVASSTKDINGADNGSFAMSTKDLATGAPPAAGSCVTIMIRREVAGSVDPAFAPEATFKANRIDFVNVTLVP